VQINLPRTKDDEKSVAFPCNDRRDSLPVRFEYCHTVVSRIPMNPRMQTFIYGNSEAIQAKERFTLEMPAEDRNDCRTMDQVLEALFREDVATPAATYERRRNVVATWIVMAKYDDKACGNSYSRTKLARFFQSGLIDRFLVGESVFVFEDGNLSAKSSTKRQRQKAFEF
jgi:hypothetical protein